ncbi:MAG: RNA polymerase sigma factor [Thermomicrobiales bacterium]
MENREVSASQLRWKHDTGTEGEGEHGSRHTTAVADLPDHLTPHEFVALYREQMVPVYRYFSMHISNVHDAEDLMATTLAKAFASLDHFDRTRGTAAAWLFGIARHTLRDFRRRQRPMSDVTVLEPAPADIAPSPEMQQIRAEQAQLLHSRVRQLPPAQREALTLRYFGGLHIAEIAAVLGRSEGAINLLLHRACTTLRNHYRQEAEQ